MINPQPTYVRTRAALNAVTFLLTIGINSLANILPLNGRTTGEISDSFPVFFVPAAYVFLIWFIIYALLAVFTVWQLLPSQLRRPEIRALDLPFAVANIANAGWIVFWHYGYVWTSLATICVLLLALIALYRRSRGKPSDNLDHSLRQNIWSVYLGWVSVATIANASVALSVAGWQGAPWSGASWCVIMMGVATALALLMLYRERDAIFAMIILWAIIGIGFHFSQNHLIGAGALIFGSCIAAYITIQYGQRQWPDKPLYTTSIASPKE